MALGFSSHNIVGRIRPDRHPSCGCASSTINRPPRYAASSVNVSSVLADRRRMSAAFESTLTSPPSAVSACSRRRQNESAAWRKRSATERNPRIPKQFRPLYRRQGSTHLRVRVGSESSSIHRRCEAAGYSDSACAHRPLFREAGRTLRLKILLQQRRPPPSRIGTSMAQPSPVRSDGTRRTSPRRRTPPSHDRIAAAAETRRAVAPFGNPVTPETIG